jgi:hypothetical protein
MSAASGHTYWQPSLLNMDCDIVAQSDALARLGSYHIPCDTDVTDLPLDRFRPMSRLPCQPVPAGCPQQR